jgi:hypothetical protein
MLTNPVNYIPAVTFSHARIVSIETGYVAVGGGARSLPADLESSRPSSRILPPARKEHPDEPSTSGPSLEPSHVPVRE